MIHVVGHTATDHIFKVPHLPNKNTSTQILDHQVFFGGGAANIAVGIATLGGESTLVSAVGGDFAGSEYDTWLDKHKVGRYFYIEEGCRTPLACMFTDARIRSPSSNGVLPVHSQRLIHPPLTSSIWRQLIQPIM